MNPHAAPRKPDTMPLGVSAFAWTAHLRERHLDLLPELRSHGLSSFEIAMFDPLQLPLAKIRRATEATQLACSVCAILPPGINPISPDAGVRTRSVQHLNDCIAAAAEMGATLIAGPVYAPIGYLPGRRRNADEWQWAIEALQSITPTLDAHGVDLAFEPVNRSETFLLNTANEALHLCEAINHPRVGITIDTFHANIEEKHIAHAIQALGKHLKHMHMSENDRGLLGSGHVDFPAILDALRQIGYAGCLMIEGFGFSPDEPGSPGALWADPNVTPAQIAFESAAYVSGLLHHPTRDA